MRVATGDAVIPMDGDLQDPPELIEEFYKKWREGYDVVYGVRVQREMPYLWELAYKGFYRLFQRLAYIRVPADAGDFSLIDTPRSSTRCSMSCPSATWPTARGLRAWAGFRQIGVPYKRPERMFGRSTNNLGPTCAIRGKGTFSGSRTSRSR